MITFSNKNYIYLGRGAGKEIHEKIKTAEKSVKIVSPYLSPDYLKDLINLHKNGIKVTLVTCDNIETSPYSDFKVKDLVIKKIVYNEKLIRFKKRLTRISNWLFISSLILLIPAFIFPVMLVLISVLLIAGFILFLLPKFISDYSAKYDPIFRIKVFDSTSGKNPKSTELIHSKIFVIDEEIAFLGSVNFTYAGFKTHYETTIKVEDKKAVKDISEEVEKLYCSNDLKAKKPEEWVKGESEEGW